MKFWSKIILFLALTFIAWIFYWAIFTPKQEVSQRIYQTLKEQEQRADLAFKEVSFEEVLAGVKYWQLFATSASVNKSTQIATLKEAKGTFFRSGKPVLCFRSPAALWDMKNKEILLDQPLGYDIKLERKINTLLQSLKNSPLSIFNLPKLYNQSLGYWFKAKNLSWKMADQQLLCTGGIILSKGEVTGYANQLSGDVGLERVFLQGTPKIIITPNNSVPISLEANEFEIISNEDTIIAKGNPVITWSSAKVVSTQMAYKQKTQEIKLNGEVKVNYLDIAATGNQATYRANKGEIILVGNAQAVQGDNKLTGNEVYVSLLKKTIAIAGRAKVIIPEEVIK